MQTACVQRALTSLHKIVEEDKAWRRRLRNSLQRNEVCRLSEDIGIPCKLLGLRMMVAFLEALFGLANDFRMSWERVALPLMLLNMKTSPSFFPEMCAFKLFFSPNMCAFKISGESRRHLSSGSAHLLTAWIIGIIGGVEKASFVACSLSFHLHIVSSLSSDRADCCEFFCAVRTLRMISVSNFFLNVENDICVSNLFLNVEKISVCPISILRMISVCPISSLVIQCSALDSYIMLICALTIRSSSVRSFGSFRR